MADEQHDMDAISPPLGRVLLAEDDRAMRDLIALRLRREGYQVVEARSGIDLLDRIEHELADHDRIPADTVIVSDIHMRRLGGLDVLDTIRSLGWETPVILITAFGDDETRVLASRLGARAVIDKPFDLAVLVNAVHDAVSRH
jgi:CheY-like chemotaxis protein